MRTNIITHRGLDPSRPSYFGESSLEAFTDQLARGYGLEFDVQFSSDGVMIAVHDADLKRITKGKDTRKVSDVTAKEILSMEFNGSHLTTVPHVLSLVEAAGGDRISALHLKSKWQEEKYLEVLVGELKKVSAKNLIVFDTKPAAARFLKDRLPDLDIAASVAHPYDIERYNAAVGGTLLTVDEVLANNAYTWVWLDEWDRADKNGGTKALYTPEVFKIFRTAGLKIALVTPELHASSPGLLGGEAHSDAVTHKSLMARIQEILDLNPNAVCTDFPDEVKVMIDF